ncbi:MAG: sulfide:quinone reductase [Sulfurimonas sp. RIFOXYD12_FULL_33_39]|uniref:NAD(P)/FAD-dependent oxidoreductase n=1 Tax=unclassified Sulfurimonas TaxID=2623549 RepID=UPI0008CDE968|nr:MULTISPECIES: FAD-dependent oxidoreductase [unclassified Sulfurimonas]OHE09105.1 MAG: sulfide:quinone reductase [Sulfurimonas sp. RIFOXYD12_FULL_33_39]OHE14422.1 MAG: sulfide:quinone reductase [Sulfurimonas sp. RIFOXYD2_FULL_34_21]DAB27271.1 MAG TPA: sulfide:quinone reductase [Sulfurimonas sp. UBA10385]
MARLVVLGGGVSGHTAATFAAKWLGSAHEVVVVTPNSKWNWIPSNIWVGVGEMSKEDVTFDLAPVYAKAGIIYHQAKALGIHPEGNETSDKPYVVVESTVPGKEGQIENIEYDYLINATGPKLNFAATPGLGDANGLGEFTVSVCTADHAVHANHEFQKAIQKMKNGERQKFLIGTGHGLCTCQGAAFEYIFNIEHELNKAGVRDMADLKWISNESFLGDFGVGGLHMKSMGFAVSSRIFAESLFTERNVDWIIGAHVNKVEKGKVSYELLSGEMGEESFDFAMLIPPFAGVGLKAIAKDGTDITATVFAPNGFMKVDANYAAGAYENWKASDWPSTYQNPTYGNMFACGIAFAPPHPISKPMSSPNGTPINPTPPRTGMPSGIIGKAVAHSICDRILKGENAPLHEASMAHMGAACVASAGKGLFDGTAAAMTIYPVVPDFEKYPGTGRDTDYTFGEIGLAGHWIKHILHHLFIWKAKLKTGWTMIPE